MRRQRKIEDHIKICWSQFPAISFAISQSLFCDRAIIIARPILPCRGNLLVYACLAYDILRFPPKFRYQVSCQLCA